MGIIDLFGALDPIVILAVYSAVAVTVLIYTLWKKKLLTAEDLQNIGAGMFLVLKVLNDEGLVNSDNMLAFAEQVFSKAYNTKDNSVLGVIQQQFDMLKTAMKKKAEEPQPETPPE